MLYRREVKWQRNAKIFRTEGWKELLQELRCEVLMFVCTCSRESVLKLVVYECRHGF